MGPKGGLGRYTRRRAWVRRAGLVERTERVSGVAAGEGVKKRESEKEREKEKVRRRSENKGVSGAALVGERSESRSDKDRASSIRKRKSMPPSTSSERSFSKDVD